MKRNTLNFIVDAALALVVLGLIATGLLIRFVLPPGSGSRRVLLGLCRHDWGDIHFWISFAGGVLLLVHLALHWQWVCLTVLRLCRPVVAEDNMHRRALRRNLFGAALVLILIGLFWGMFVAARYGVQETDAADGRLEGRERGENTPLSKSVERDDDIIQGINDVGANTCIPCKKMAPILEELKTTMAGQLQVDFIDVLKNPDAGASTGIVQRYLNWTSQSKAALVTRRICGVLVLIGDIYLIHVAP